jgi:hypothetical protein
MALSMSNAASAIFSTASEGEVRLNSRQALLLKSSHRACSYAFTSAAKENTAKINISVTCLSKQSDWKTLVSSYEVIFSHMLLADQRAIPDRRRMREFKSRVTWLSAGTREGD